MDIDQLQRIEVEALERFERAERVAREWFDRGWLPQLAHYEEHLKQLALQMQHHEEYLKRRRERCEAMLAKSKHCGRERYSGVLSIQETKADGVDVVVGVSLVCNQCAYEKYPSPEFASCEAADEFLDAAIQLGGTPPFPASLNA